MAKRISPKNIGSTFHLLFDKNTRFTGPVDDRKDNVLVRIEGEGDDKRAVFNDPEIGEWEAYRWNGRWAYGSSCEPLRVIE
jgi:hypothetical protein